jgi:hypothetical protein
MATPKHTSVPERALALYRAALAAVPGLEEKSNFGAAYTAINGNMYSMISKHGLVGVRLPPAEREAFMAEHGTGLFRGDPAWPPAKEFVAVPEAMLADTARLAALIERAFAHTKTLKPKPTTRPKKAKA